MAPTSSSSEDESTGVLEKRNVARNPENRNAKPQYKNQAVCSNAVGIPNQKDATNIAPKLAVKSKVEDKHEIKQEPDQVNQEQRLVQACLGHLQRYYANLCEDCEACRKTRLLLLHKKNCILVQCNACQLVEKTIQFHKDCCSKVPRGKDDYCIFCAKIMSGGAHEEVETPSTQETIVAEMTKIQESSLEGTKFVDGKDYEVTGDLGQGGNGQVMEVKLLDSGMKKLPGIHDDSSMAAKIANVSEHEIDICKRIFGTENTVKHYFLVEKKQQLLWKNRRTGEEEPKDFQHVIFMERADMSLLKYRNESRNRILSLEEASFFFTQVVKALVACHELSVVHKDIKSSNVLLKDIGHGRFRILLADFEFAVRLRPGLRTEKLRLGGTKLFIAPEVLARQEHGTAADIYGVGMLFLELAVPKAVNPPRNVCWSEYQAAKIQELKDMHSQIGKVIESCLETDVNKRPSAPVLLQKMIDIAFEAGWWHVPTPALE